MEINTNSWHYKVYDWTYYNFLSGSESMPEQTNLCQYTQRIFWHTLKYAFFWFTVTFMAGLVVYGAGLGVFHLVRWAKWWMLLIPVIAYALYHLRFVPDRVYDSETTRLFGAWVSARKRGICPLVTFTDGPTKSDE